MQIQPYLYFGGRCEEALAFYGKALGAKVNMMMRFKEMPAEEGQGGAGGDGQPPLPAGWEDKIMHASVTVGQSEIMASDGMPGAPPEPFAGFSLSIVAPSMDQARQWFDALSEGGRVMMPMQKTFWSEGFGMLQDRFGLSWMVNVAH